ncbi:PPE family protein [Mycolicibacter icosiumassiliensis]|uniref:PPE family protein n=1 Tax=Mycolicibacter icosiumassiliensis TaxID=1792835 RepID=UPI000836FC00|nr:PPE family protein [Mycolicibacter icosiumassiliensis]
MLDFGVLPPEVTSSQIYSGPGSGSMMAAASAWDGLASQLNLFAGGYASMISALEGDAWSGPAANAMVAAAVPYIDWVKTTAGQAEQVANQARTAATAFETAHASVVPPALVAANRAQLSNLLATNVFGQNAPQIAATDAQYAQMWAQNTQAMYGYAGSSLSATRLSTFTQPPETSNPTAQPSQAVATAAQSAGAGASHANSLSQLLSSVPQQLSTAATSASSSSSTSTLFGMPVPSSLLTSLGNLNTIDGPISFAAAMVRTAANSSAAGMIAFRLFADAAIYSPLAGLSGAMSPVTFSSASLGAGLAGVTTSSAAGVQSAVLASTGGAGLMGSLSVPSAWAQATPVATASEQPMWLSEVEAWWEDGAPANLDSRSMAQVAAAAAAGSLLMRPVVGKALRVPPRRFKMSRPSAGG